MTTYAYLRVSSRGQKIDRQLKYVGELGIEPKNIYIDKCSGSTFQRKEYNKLKKKLKKNDILWIKSLDRLGRNYKDVINEWSNLTKEKGIIIHVEDMPILNFDESDSPLLKVFIEDLVLQVLSFMAENELNNIHQRQAEGIRIAKEKGIKFGREPLKRPGNFKKIKKSYYNKEITSREAGKILGISQTTFLRWCKE